MPPVAKVRMVWQQNDEDPSAEVSIQLQRLSGSFREISSSPVKLQRNWLKEL